MSFIDKVRNKLAEAKGVIKEETGRATGNERMEYEGKLEKGKARAKQAGEHVKDAATDVKNVFKKD